MSATAQSRKARTEASSARLVLASGSETRAALLRQAGLEFSLQPAEIDEKAMKESLRAERASATEAVAVLAELKAARVSRQQPDALVIGADQILDCDGAWFGKPAELEDARAQLGVLKGREHRLLTSVCVVRDGERLWHHVEEARLVMRAFSDSFLDSYLKTLGADALETVGGYRLEGSGVQLFERIEGDYFAILGLPVLQLLAFLREQGALEP